MEKVLVLDLETRKAFSQVRRGKIHELGVSVVGLYDYARGAYETYMESEISRLEPHLRQARLVVGFNIRRFDLPVLQPYLFLSTETLPVLDLLEEIEKVRGHRVSLQSVAQATFGKGKLGHGWEAIQLFKEGRIEELKRYCLEDVRLTKEVYEYGQANGKILFQSTKDWKVYEVPVSWGKEAVLERKASDAFPTSLF